MKKTYSFVATQEGESNPTAKILKNTLDGIPAWERIGAGKYKIILENGFVGFVPNVIGLNYEDDFTGEGQGVYTIVKLDDSTLLLTTGVYSNGTFDGILNRVKITVDVYNI